MIVTLLTKSGEAKEGKSRKSGLFDEKRDCLKMNSPFFIFGHIPCLLAAPEGASTVWHAREGLLLATRKRVKFFHRQLVR